MTKNSVFALIIGLSLTFFYSCGGGNKTGETQTDSVEVMGVEPDINVEKTPEQIDSLISSIRFGGIGLDIKKEEVIKRLGNPEKTETMEDPVVGSLEKYFYPSQGVSVNFLDNSVVLLQLKEPFALKDRKNLGIGSSEKEFLASYNSHEYSGSKTFDVTIENGEVTQIDLVTLLN
jgi:hypothetical protein